MVSLGLESNYYSEDEEVQEKKLSKAERIKLKEELEELFEFFEGGENDK